METMWQMPKTFVSCVVSCVVCLSASPGLAARRTPPRKTVVEMKYEKPITPRPPRSAPARALLSALPARVRSPVPCETPPSRAGRPSGRDRDRVRDSERSQPYLVHNFCSSNIAVCKPDDGERIISADAT